MTLPAVEFRAPRVRGGFKIALLLASIVLAHAIWDYVEGRRLHARIDAIVRAGEPITIVRTTRLTGGAAESDRLYRAAAALGSGLNETMSSEVVYRIRKAERDGVWTPELVQEARTLLAANEDAMSLIDRAAALPFDGFTMNAEFVYLNGSLLSLSSLCELRTTIRALDGQGDSAGESIYTDVRLARTQTRLASRRPFTALPLVFRRARPSPAVVARLSEGLAQLDRDDAYKQEFVAQRAINLSGAERGIRNMTWLAQPWITHRLTRQLDTFSSLIAAASRPSAERVQAMLDVGAWPFAVPFELPSDRSRAQMEFYVKALVHATDSLHCARRLVAGEVVDCPF